ncbi:MAG: pyruvate dehydrogenase (acetyl-transferring), homodimeric type, partial [Candidatus Acidiferrales bacterium]
ENSEEIQYLRARRQELGGYVPQRRVRSEPLVADHDELFAEFLNGSEGRGVSTTMAFVSMLRKMLRDPEMGKLIVPIVPDEARTFGMESLFRTVGIYSSVGQRYEPVDVNTLLYYNETKDGQILEEGITEAGSMASFIAAGTAYATHGINTIPFFIYYSMFGFQRIADFIWAAADMRVRGFMLGGTSGRTTLAGEGLQHQDGNSQVLALPVPNLRAYDPAYAYEVAVIIQDGIRRMYKDGESIFYYITVMNEPYAMPEMPGDVRQGILKGMYRFRTATIDSPLRAQLFGSGAILNEALQAQEVLAQKYNVAADVWSVTSYKSLYSDGIETERWNRLHPGEKPRVPYLSECLKDAPGVFVAATDYLKTLPNMISQWVPRRLASLGTDGFGRSEIRSSLRDFFEVDARFITLAALDELLLEGKIERSVVEKAMVDLGINADKPNPVTC